eukprot:Gregarina_sp_Poly_1__1093@NODE_1267_length_4555_cov_121_407977_g862_i0_p3_GENE_NODE_1267_length_4555_cov_121_407977_g862_i0NODE_1267_length_4555_cov_121_407977_g862_i0_p3_ORF_typecomplete_len270_score32_71_NODE_1267_length_4555_cov_121_407977_g862_i027812
MPQARGLSQKRRTYPVPTVFAVAGIVEASTAATEWISLTAVPGFHFNWVRYFSQYPQSKETDNGIRLPPSSTLLRKSAFDLMGEAVIEVSRISSSFQNLTMNVHVSFFVRDLRSIQRRRFLKSKTLLTSRDDKLPASAHFMNSASHNIAASSTNIYSSESSLPNTPPPLSFALYLNHHELRRFQILHPNVFSINFSLLPSVMVKVCNGSQTKVETTGKYIPLKVAKDRSPFIRSQGYVPSPSSSFMHYGIHCLFSIIIRKL